MAINVNLVIMRINARLQSKSQIDRIPDDVKELLDDDRWKEAKRKDGTTFNRWQEFRAADRPWGLGISDPKKLLDLCRNHPVLPQLRNSERHQGERDFHNNVMEVAAVQGNSKAYTLARLQRDRPDLLDRVQSGELSANAAAIEAGFRKKPTPMDAAKKAIGKMTEVDRRELMAYLKAILG